MNGKDLRIGNFISVLGNTVEVIKILGEKKIEIHSDILQFWDVDIEDEDEDVKPIPLTEEWLLKFGFEKNDDFISEDHLWSDFIKKGVRIQLPYFDWKDSDGEISFSVKSVHQLQNLFYSITGEELTIKS